MADDPKPSPKKKKKKRKARGFKKHAPGSRASRKSIKATGTRDSDGTSGYDGPNARFLEPGIEYELRGKHGNIRCTRRMSNGNQCTNNARRGYIYCPQHAGFGVVGGGRPISSTTERAATYRFGTERWDEFYANQLDNPLWNDLREEVALSRTAAQLMLEVAKKRMIAADAQKDPILKAKAQLTASAMLNQMATEVAELVDKAARVQKAVGRTIDAKDVDVFLEQVAIILNSEIEDTDVLYKIFMRFRGAQVPTGGTRDIAEWPVMSQARAAFDAAAHNGAVAALPAPDEGDIIDVEAKDVTDE
jgi:hypothetical protein